MIDKLKQSKQAGIFSISPGRDIYGELTLAGDDTILYLRDKDFFQASAIPDQCVRGVLHDLTKVTLVKCITTSDLCVHSRGEEKYNSASIFPHYVVLGDSHISPNDETVTEVHFVVDDASTLFNDFEAFGSLINAHQFIEQIAHANGREIAIGPNPQIQYFTGKEEIFTAETTIGRISASHNPSFDFGGPDGVAMKNIIYVTISFHEAITFEKSIAHTATLLRYFEILVGRPQNLISLGIQISGGRQDPDHLQVYWSNPPQRSTSHGEKNPHPRSVLIDAVRQPDYFARVLTSWIAREAEWRDARVRFSSSFAQQRYFSIERLIGAANIFDILPSSAIPRDVKLSGELESAKADCQEIFKNLTQSAERDSVLNVLGRLGKSALKHKVRHRSQPLLGLFQNIDLVTDEAVNCRNHYVHGSEPRFDYSNNFDTVIFLTRTLEFVFATSDLAEAGWDIANWANTTSPFFHPFAEYHTSYDENLRRLKSLLPPTVRSRFT
jgi:ApeA N-terminal domain 1/Apea-like HEPN